MDTSAKARPNRIAEMEKEEAAHSKRKILIIGPSYHAISANVMKLYQPTLAMHALHRCLMR